MATTSLVESSVELGQKILEAMDAEKVSVSGAFWLRDVEDGQWHYVIASRTYDTSGPIDAYARVTAALQKHTLEKELSLDQMIVISPNHPKVAALRRAFRIRGETVRLQDCVINGMQFEEAYIYRMS